MRAHHLLFFLICNLLIISNNFALQVLAMAGLSSLSLLHSNLDAVQVVSPDS
jgi:hypothetical protein